LENFAAKIVLLVQTAKKSCIKKYKKPIYIKEYDYPLLSDKTPKALGVHAGAESIIVMASRTRVIMRA
jgi:hypothetical protein